MQISHAVNEQGTGSEYLKPKIKNVTGKSIQTLVRLLNLSVIGLNADCTLLEIRNLRGLCMDLMAKFNAKTLLKFIMKLYKNV